MPFEALDPLMHLWKAGKSMDIKLPMMTLQELAADFRETVLSLLEFGIANRGRLTTVFERLTSFLEEKRTLFLIELLGEVGRSSSIRTLESLVETRQYGEASVEAIRLIRKRE